MQRASGRSYRQTDMTRPKLSGSLHSAVVFKLRGTLILGPYLGGVDVHLLHIPHNPGPGLLILGVPIDQDIASDFALGFAPSNDVHEGGLSSPTAPHEGCQHPRAGEAGDALEQLQLGGVLLALVV